MTFEEMEQVQKLVRDAYNEGFLEGMKEETSSRGGNPFDASRASRLLSARLAEWLKGEKIERERNGSKSDE